MNLRAARAVRNISQAELARLSGRGLTSIHYYESGRAKPSLEAIDAIAAALSVQPHDLLAPPPYGNAA